MVKLRAIRETKIEISSCEQFEAVQDLLYLLNRSFLIAEAENARSDIRYHFAETWDRCEYCERPLGEGCYCDEDHRGDDRDIYNDEVDFDGPY